MKRDFSVFFTGVPLWGIVKHDSLEKSIDFLSEFHMCTITLRKYYNTYDPVMVLYD